MKHKTPPVPLGRKVARLAYNDRDWGEPSGWIGKSKGAGTQEAQYGFGHEEWLFDFTKQIDGYQYGFIQGVDGKTHFGKSYDLLLYTINGVTKERYPVARINRCRILSADEQTTYKTIFRKRKWISKQQQQLKDLNLPAKSLKNIDCFQPNVCFQEVDAKIFTGRVHIGTGLDNYDRYNFYDWNDKIEIPSLSSGEFDFISSKPIASIQVWRKKHTEIICREIKQRHRDISLALFNNLSSKYGEANLACDVMTSAGTAIDMVRRDKNQFVLYEIKTYNQLRKNIREAIGQLLEYAYWEQSKKIKELIIVSDRELDDAGKKFLDRLRQQFSIPIYYLPQPI